MVMVKCFVRKLVRAFSTENIRVLLVSFGEVDYIMLIGFEEVKLEVKEIKISGKPVFIKVSDFRNFGEHGVIVVIIMRDSKAIVSWLEVMLCNLVV